MLGQVSGGCPADVGATRVQMRVSNGKKPGIDPQSNRLIDEGH